MILILLLACSTSAYAASLQSSDATLIETAGVPVFSKATFVYGNRDVGFRFASSVLPADVKQWYREQLPQWSVFDKFGSWLMYDGKPGLDMGEVMSKNQISIQKNDKLPEWYSVDKNMTTEIVIMIVK